MRQNRAISHGRGALNNIGENLVFLRRFPGDTEQIAQTDDKGGRVSRSVWSAWSLLPLSDVWRGSKAGASSTHAIRFARFGSCYAGLGTDAPYPPLLLRHYVNAETGVNLRKAARLAVTSAGPDVWPQIPQKPQNLCVFASLR